MAFINKPSKEVHIVAGGSVFPFEFKWFDASDITVYYVPPDETPDDTIHKLSTAQYTIASNASKVGGSITITIGVVDGGRVTIQRRLPITRKIDFTKRGSFFSATVNDDQDYQTYLALDAYAESLSFLKQDASGEAGFTLPAPGINEEYIRWDVNGELVNDTEAPAWRNETEELKWEAEAEKLSAISSASEAVGVFVKLYTSNGDGTFTATNTTYYSAFAEAVDSASEAHNSQLRAWEAEAEKLTASSRASEAEDIAVNIVTSDADGTFTYTPTNPIEYSSLHYSAKAQGIVPAPTGDDNGKYLQVDETGNPVYAPVINFKNKFVNGTLLSWQEGVPTGITTIFTTFADVFGTSTNSGATLDISQQKLSNNAEGMRMTAIVASTDLTGINNVVGFQVRQFENQDFAHLKDKEVTLQFKFKASEIGNYPIVFRDATLAESYVTTFNYSTADTEQLVTFTINLDSTRLDFTVANNALLFTMIIGNDNNGTYQLADVNKDSWQLGQFRTTDACVNWSTVLNAYVEVGDIQIEEGSVSTEVERPDVGSNFARCQRYYQGLGRISFLSTSNGTTQYVTRAHAVEMRDIPAFTALSTADTDASGWVCNGATLASRQITRLQGVGVPSANAKRIDVQFNLDARL